MNLDKYIRPCNCGKNYDRYGFDLAGQYYIAILCSNVHCSENDAEIFARNDSERNKLLLYVISNWNKNVVENM